MSCLNDLSFFCVADMTGGSDDGVGALTGVDFFRNFPPSLPTFTVLSDVRDSEGCNITVTHDFYNRNNK